MSVANPYIWYSTLKDSLKQIHKVDLSGISAYDHWIPFRHSNLLSYKAMCLTRTQSHVFTATPIPSFVECHEFFELAIKSWPK